ncbi:MAG: TolC family protein [Bacteroidota bacterium]
MMRKFSSILAQPFVGLLLILGLHASTFAQGPSLSLSDAIRIALEKNFDIRVEEARTEIAANNNSWANAGLYPNLTLQLASNNRLSNVDNPASFINGQFSNLGITGTLNTSWTIFNGFRVHITKEKLDLLEGQSQGNAAIVVENSLQAVILQYYNARVAEAQRDALAENLALSRDRVRFEQTRSDLGTGSTFQLLTAQNAYYADSSAFLGQELALTTQLRNLAKLLGFDEDTRLTLTDDLRETFTSFNFGDLKGKMLSNNRTLQNQFVNLRILQQDIDLAKSARYPTVTFNLGSTWSQNRFELEGQGVARGSQLDFYGNFSLNFTLYGGGAITRQIENADIQTRVTQIGIDQLRLDMSHELRNTFDLYTTRLELFNLAEATLALARKNESIAEIRFQNGTLNSFNFRDVQLAFRNAALARNQALYNLLEAETMLLRLTGGILDLSSE